MQQAVLLYAPPKLSCLHAVENAADKDLSASQVRQQDCERVGSQSLITLLAVIRQLVVSEQFGWQRWDFFVSTDRKGVKVRGHAASCTAR